jgi:hypothetical protein
MKKVLI